VGPSSLNITAAQQKNGRAEDLQHFCNGQYSQPSPKRHIFLAQPPSGDFWTTLMRCLTTNLQVAHVHSRELVPTPEYNGGYASPKLGSGNEGQLTILSRDKSVSFASQPRPLHQKGDVGSRPCDWTRSIMCERGFGDCPGSRKQIYLGNSRSVVRC
jgi:hypothetical protein